MPEYRESWCHWRFLRWLRWNGFSKNSWQVRGLWADLTEDEGKARKHYGVLQMDSSSKLPRGGSGGYQTQLWPPAWAKGEPGASENLLESLTLDDENCIRYTARAIILDFGPLILKFSYLLHTSIQVYTREIWERKIVPECTKTRSAKIALAIEFDDHFLCFLSKDLMVQPEWVTREVGSLGFKEPNPPDVYNDFLGFLSGVVEWLKVRSRESRTGLASSILKTDKDARRFWHGLGVYSINEVFPLSGLSPFLSEAEVFDNPSRTARLCAAFYAFTARACDNDRLWTEIVRPAVDKRYKILAPTSKQREKYADWLRVHSKDCMKMSARMGALVDQHRMINDENKTGATWYRDDPGVLGLYDCFEPYEIREALDKVDFEFLHPLIFGGESSSDDPLTLYFQSKGVNIGSDACTFLKPGIYEPKPNLYPESERKWGQRPTYVYKVGTRTVWSIVQPFPPNSQPKQGLKATGVGAIRGPLIDVWLEKEKDWDPVRTSKLLKTIAYSNDVGVGPLEYLGNAQISKSAHKTTHIFLFRGDVGEEGTPEYFARRMLHRRHWRSNTKLKTRKIHGASKNSKRVLKKDLQELEKRFEKGRQEDDNLGGEEEERSFDADHVSSCFTSDAEIISFADTSSSAGAVQHMSEDSESEYGRPLAGSSTERTGLLERYGYSAPWFTSTSYDGKDSHLGDLGDLEPLPPISDYEQSEPSARSSTSRSTSPLPSITTVTTTSQKRKRKPRTSADASIIAQRDSSPERDSIGGNQRRRRRNTCQDKAKEGRN